MYIFVTFCTICLGAYNIIMLKKLNRFQQNTSLLFYYLFGISTLISKTNINFYRIEKIKEFINVFCRYCNYVRINNYLYKSCIQMLYLFHLQIFPRIWFSDNSSLLHHKLVFPFINKLSLIMEFVA